MTRDEIERYLNTGRSRSVCVDRSLVPEYPGYVRTVTIHEGNRISVEFDTHGADEGGPLFEAAFAALDAAIASLEAYLHAGMSEWINYSASGAYPDETALSPEDAERGHQKLIAAISARSVALPSGDFQLKDDGFWTQYLAGSRA